MSPRRLARPSSDLDPVSGLPEHLPPELLVVVVALLLLLAIALLRVPALLLPVALVIPALLLAIPALLAISTLLLLTIAAALLHCILEREDRTVRVIRVDAHL